VAYLPILTEFKKKNGSKISTKRMKYKEETEYLHTQACKIIYLKINKNNYIDDPATLNFYNLPHFTLIESLNLMSILDLVISSTLDLLFFWL
jgi:hypothetical protein